MSELQLTDVGEELKVKIDGDERPIIEIDELPEGVGAKLCELVAAQFPFMPNASESPIKLPRLFLKRGFENKVVFYGGAFQPWHKGHRVCLDLCPSTGIVVVPDNNPWKDDIVRSECPWKQYIDLCRELRDTNYSVYPGFISSDKPNPTIDWLPAVNVKERGLIVGDDNFLAFDKWREYEKLLGELNQLYVVPRQGDVSKLQSMKKKLNDLNPDLSIIFLPHHDYEAYSSTWAREH